MIKNLPANAGDVDSIPGLERSAGGGNGTLLQWGRSRNYGRVVSWQELGWGRLGKNVFCGFCEKFRLHSSYSEELLEVVGRSVALY